MTKRWAGITIDLLHTACNENGGKAIKIYSVPYRLNKKHVYIVETSVYTRPILLLFLITSFFSCGMILSINFTTAVMNTYLCTSSTLIAMTFFLCLPKWTDRRTIKHTHMHADRLQYKLIITSPSSLAHLSLMLHIYILCHLKPMLSWHWWKPTLDPIYQMQPG